MKYTITINQVGIAKAGLADKTDIVDWAIIDYLKDWFFSEKKKTIMNQEDGEKYVWVNYSHLLDNMPILKFNKDTLSRRIKKLKKLGLLKTFATRDNTLYFVLTRLAVDVCFYNENNRGVHENEQGSHEKEGVLTKSRQGVDKIKIGGVDKIKTATNSISNQIETNNSNYNIVPTDKISVETDANGFAPLTNNLNNNNNKINLSAKDKYFRKVDDFFANPDEDWYNQLLEIFPDVDFEKLFQKMKLWLKSNYPTHIKKNFKRFAMNWINKSADKGQLPKKPKKKEPINIQPSKTPAEIINEERIKRGLKPFEV